MRILFFSGMGPQFQWKKWRKTNSAVPPKRCGHAAVAVQEVADTKLYVCSGIANPTYPPVDNNDLVIDLWSYSTRN
jgi:hypothetical protein